MEKVLLGVAGVWAEVGLDEFEEALFGGLALREVELGDGALDPDIDRKGVLKSVGEEENAVGDFFAYAGEGAEGFAGGGRGEEAERFEVEVVGCDDLSGLEEIGRAEAHFAGAELGFGERGETGGGGEGIFTGGNRENGGEGGGNQIADHGLRIADCRGDFGFQI